MDRADHLEWCKRRALEYVEAGNLDEAFNSMVSDLSKHEGTMGHVGIQLGMVQKMCGGLSTLEQTTEFITGFN